ncbi:MAG: alkane 1-monooxygenase [Stenotrophomonas sp.]|nr:MAG: alkane 1-monooxygenase [Stenotrophomonas sp.]
MVKYSILDLVMIPEGRDLSSALAGSVALAQAAEKSGYERYWVAEHHNIPGIASSATTIIIATLAQATTSIRVGSGGMMLPNHSPLVVAEQFATLDALYPGRIDLGIGRAPGGSAETTLAVRGVAGVHRELADDVCHLQHYLADDGALPIRAIPEPHDVPIWILGSGMYGAKLAAERGLPFAFASHFAPRFLLEAIELYRKSFRPSPKLRTPYVTAGVNVFAADSYAEAEFIASSHRDWVVRRNRAQGVPLPKPSEGLMARIHPREREAMEMELGCTALGTIPDIQQWLRGFVGATGVDEIMIDARIHDQNARIRSHQLTAEAIRTL